MSPGDIRGDGLPNERRGRHSVGARLTRLPDPGQVLRGLQEDQHGGELRSRRYRRQRDRNRRKDLRRTNGRTVEAEFERRIVQSG